MSHRRGALVLIVLDILLLVTLVAGLTVRSRSRGVSEPLFEFDATDASRIVITRRAANAVRSIVLDGSVDWELVDSGARYPARADRVEPLLDELDRARIVRTVGSGSGLIEQFSLAAPAEGETRTAARVDLEAGSFEASLLFGETESVTDQIYVRRPGDDRVAVARAAVDFYLQQPATFWAYLRLFPESARAGDVVRVTVAREGGDTLVLNREPSATGEQWFVESGGGQADGRLPADGDSVRSLSRDLADLVGDGFYQDATFGSLAGVASVSFSTSDGRTFGVDVRSDGDLLIARPSGPALPGEPYGGLLYTIAPSTLRRIVPEREELIAR